jgi:hypothetical protein
LAKPNFINYIPFAKTIFTKGILMKMFIVLFLLLSFSILNAADNNYYPKSFIDSISSQKLTNEALKAEINTLLTSPHQKDSKGGKDTLGCDVTGVKGCYEHRSLGYDGARKILFGKLHVEEKEGKFFIKDVYCHKIFSSNSGVKPGAIPNNNQINCEHTWPQSKFSSNYPKDTQKSDLHHLFPTDSKANSIRGNFDFAEISTDSGKLSDDDCSASKSGVSAAGGSDDLFEPPTEHKGNVARALFYFSVRYKIKIPATEEIVLRRWNDLDPIDNAEEVRNEQIYFAQGSRNPFIDFPELANSINKF